MVIDSHALLWWLEGSPSLSATAGALLLEAENKSRICRVSAVTLWEFRMKEVRGSLVPSRPVRRWPEWLERLHWLRIESTNAAIWLSAAELEWSHRDPADRIIAATALHFGVPVLTKDARFHAPECPAEAVW